MVFAEQTRRHRNLAPATEAPLHCVTASWPLGPVCAGTDASTWLSRRFSNDLYPVFHGISSTVLIELKLRLPMKRERRNRPVVGAH